MTRALGTPVCIIKGYRFEISHEFSRRWIDQRTFLSSSTSSALKISNPLLSTIASLASRLNSRSSFELNIALFRRSPSAGFLDSSATRIGIGILGDDGPATGEDGCVEVLPDSTESREDWKDELPVSSSDFDEPPAPFVAGAPSAVRPQTARELPGAAHNAPGADPHAPQDDRRRARRVAAGYGHDPPPNGIRPAPS